MTEIRPPAERAAHARHLLETEIDAWVASATADGEAYLLPLSYYWDGAALLFSTPETSRTARDLGRAGRTRVSLPSARDVVIMDGAVEFVDPSAIRSTVDAFAAHHDWDPRNEPNAYAFFRFIPDRIQAWRTASELSGRTVMRDGRWIDDGATAAS